MARNFVQDGATLDVTAPAAVAAGVGVLVGANLFGIALNSAASGAPVRIRTEGVFDIAKAAGFTVSAGQRVFWVPGTSTVNVTATGQVCVGVAVAAAASGDLTVRVKLAPAAIVPSGT